MSKEYKTTEFYQNLMNFSGITKRNYLDLNRFDVENKEINESNVNRFIKDGCIDPSLNLNHDEI